MGYALSKLIEDKIKEIKDEQIKEVCLLLLEYAEIQGGTWKQIRDESNSTCTGPHGLDPDSDKQG